MTSVMSNVSHMQNYTLYFKTDCNMAPYQVLLTCPPMIGVLDRLTWDRTQFDIVAPTFVQTLSEEKLVQILPDFDAWIIGDDPATRRVLESGRDRLRCVVKWGVGTDNVCRAALEEMGIPFTNTPGLFGKSVSDVAIGMLLMLTRQLHCIHNSVRDGSWLKPLGDDISEMTACIIGLGSIGRCVAHKLKAFGCRVLAMDPAYRASVNGHACHKTDSRLDIEHVEVIQRSGVCSVNILIVCCDLNDSTRGMVDSSFLSDLQRGAYVINASRGAIISEDDLVEALQKEQVKAII